MMRHFDNTVILRDFSRSDNSSKREVSENELEYVENVVEGYKLRYYASGNCDENKGYVSIIFNYCKKTVILPRTEIRFFFSVVDVFGSKRFTQSIVLIPSETELPDSTKDSRSNSHFGLERYLRRETLLNDPAELLPGDCLTILVEIDHIPPLFLQSLPLYRQLEVIAIDNLTLVNIRKLAKYDCSAKFAFPVDECNRLYIPLDSFYGRKLCDLSGFFRLASDTILTKSTSRRVHIPDEEVHDFNIICNILFTPTIDLDVNSIEKIFHLYVIADKYDFQSVIEDCRQLIKAFLLTTDEPKIQEHAAQSVPDIIKLAEEYKDIDLKDTGKTYLESKEIFGMNDYALGLYLKERIFSDWKCVSRTTNAYPLRNLFTLSKNTKPEFESYL